MALDQVFVTLALGSGTILNAGGDAKLSSLGALKPYKTLISEQALKVS